jgi:hypothetical protein
VQFRVNVCFYRRMVFWALCRQDCGPKLGSGYYFFGQRSDVELIFLNLLCQLYAADRHSRGLELLESEHRLGWGFTTGRKREELTQTGNGVVKVHNLYIGKNYEFRFEGNRWDLYRTN